MSVNLMGLFEIKIKYTGPRPWLKKKLKDIYDGSSGSFIAACKVYRRETGAGLKETAEAVKRIVK